MSASTSPTVGERTRGLTAAAAASRLADVGPNALPEPEAPGPVARLGRELREPMAVLLLAAAGVSGLLLGEAVDAVAILAIVVLDAAIALVQEGRATRALAALTDLEAHEALVVRDGRLTVVDVRAVVPGDLVRVQAGDRVPADLELVAADGLEVDEAILTGESLPVRRGPDEPLRSGTLLLAGAGEGVVTATGADTMLGGIARELGDLRPEPTPLQAQLTRVTRWLGLVALALAVAAFPLLALTGRAASVDEAYLAAVALAVAAVPEGLAAVTTVALALGVARMARRGAIVRRLPAVETLGSTDVLLVDKTGTLTENRMAVRALVAPDGTSGELAAGDEAVDEVLALCNDATLDPPTGDPMERALLEHVGAARTEQLRSAAPRLATAGFTSERRRMGTVHRLDGRLVLLVKGAPEVVLPRCVLDDPARDRLLVEAARRAATGERLLALATRTLAAVPDDVATSEDALDLVGLVTLRDPARASAPGSVAGLDRAGVRLVMATGDHPGTATAVAAEIGLGATCVTGDVLERDGVADDPAAVDVYARLAPSQKLALVEALRARGHVVAMTGDGVNDAPALRRADIGVALGQSGSDVAREAADLVVTDDDLATIVAAVREGRGIHDNLRKVVHFLVTSNLAEVATVVAALLLFPVLGLPLHPLQLLWINLLTDGLPALALGVDPPARGLMDVPPRRRDEGLLDAGVLRRLAGRAVVLTAGTLGSGWVALEVLGDDHDTVRTVLFSTLVVAQVVYALVIRLPGGRREPNRWMLVAVVSALLAQLAVVHWRALGGVFETVPLAADRWGLVALGAVLPNVLMAALARRRGRRIR